MRQLVTDRELRRLWDQGEFHTFTVEEGTVVTPSARDFLLEHRIELRLQPKGKTMTVEPIAAAGGAPRYVIEATGERVEEKPEEMTHLRGNRLVPKTHPRILFRGKVDSLMAAFLSAEVTAAEENRRNVLEGLEELLGFLRALLAAEVKEEPLGEIRLLGLDSAGIRRVSHHVQKEIGIPHPIPSYTMGRLALTLNALRTQVRETELAAALAFDRDGRCARPDLVEGLNRLSSAVYILFCRLVAEQSDKRR